MIKQWNELKASITELRDSGGTGTQQDVCKFLVNMMEALEKQMQEPCNDTISRQAAIDELRKCRFVVDAIEKIRELPPARPDIKQAAKLLSDFIESCPGGDSYLITPDGEELRTDWGYATEGIQLIHDWAERRTDA